MRRSRCQTRALITFLCCLYLGLPPTYNIEGFPPTYNVGVTSDPIFLSTLWEQAGVLRTLPEPRPTPSSEAPGAPALLRSLPLHRPLAPRPRWAPPRAPCRPQGQSIGPDDDCCSPAAPAESRAQLMDELTATLLLRAQLQEERCL